MSSGSPASASSRNIAASIRSAPPRATWCPILALSAASFIYVAMADLVPTLHRTTGLAHSLRQLLFLLAGIATMAFFRFHH